MRDTNKHIWVLAALVLTTLAGCNVDGNREASAHRHWQRTMDEVRLQAAREGIEQGRLTYAEQVLKKCIQNSPEGSQTTEEAQQMLTEIQTAHQQFAIARARQAGQQLEEQIY